MPAPSPEVARRRGADSDHFDGVGLHLVHEDRGKRQDHGEVLRQAQAAAEKRVVDRAPATQKFYLSMLRTLQALTHTYASNTHIRQNSNVQRGRQQTSASTVGVTLTRGKTSRLLLVD